MIDAICVWLLLKLCLTLSAFSISNVFVLLLGIALRCLQFSLNLSVQLAAFAYCTATSDSNLLFQVFLTPFGSFWSCLIRFTYNSWFHLMHFDTTAILCYAFVLRGLILLNFVLPHLVNIPSVLVTDFVGFLTSSFEGTVFGSFPRF